MKMLTKLFAKNNTKSAQSTEEENEIFSNSDSKMLNALGGKGASIDSALVNDDEVIVDTVTGQVKEKEFDRESALYGSPKFG